MKRLIIVWLLFISGSIYAQNIIPRFETLGVNEGLSQSSVYSIYQDKKGFMWFGSADGLNRYDGQNIRVYKINDKKIANSNFIHGNICEDSKGNIWFCNETGLFIYDPLTDVLTRRVKFSLYSWTAGILIDKNDVFYILEPGKGVFGYHIKTNKLLTTPCTFTSPYNSFYIGAMTTDFKDHIWIKSFEKNEVLLYNLNTGKVTHHPTAIKFDALFYSGDGKLYLLGKPGKFTVTDSLLHQLDTFNYSLPAGKSFNVQALYRDAYHRVWMSTTDFGLICYNEQSRVFTHYLHDNSRLKSLPINLLTAICIDRSGNLWIGTDGGGVCKLDLKPPKFNLFPLNEGDYTFLKDYFVKCFYEDEKGRIWVGTHSSGLNIFDPVTGVVKNYNFLPGKTSGLPASVVGSIFKDRQGLLWISTSLGMACFNEKQNTFTKIRMIDGPELNEHNNFAYKVIQQQNGDLLAATYYGMMTIKKIAGAYTGVFGKLDGNTIMLFTDVVEMPDKSLWATSPLKGLIHIQRSGDNFISLGKYIPMIDLRSIHADEQDKNILWICSGIGLIKFNITNYKYVVYDEQSGMSNSYVYGVLEDQQHNLWMSTNKGICFFNRKTNTFQNYTAKDGLQSNEFNTQAFYKGPSGTMYFGGIKGFNWFNPSTVKSNSTAAPGVAVTAINIDDKPYIKDALFVKNRTISLPYDKNNISFQFAALDYTRPQANKVMFILENWDKQWIIAEDKNIRYTHLLPGNYLLRVKAANSDNVWSNEETLNVIVKAPFWQRTWFYVWAGFGLLILIIYITYFLSQQKIKKKLRLLEKQHAIDAERNRISRDMHDEIGSGLTHIALLSELIQTQQKTDIAIKNDVGSISIAARKLVESMSEIIWALNPQNDSLENLLSYIREQMQAHFEPFDLTLKINFPNEVPQIKLSNEQRRNLYLVTKEALNNVLKHANAKHVVLSLEFNDDQLKFEVTDNGQGLLEKTNRTAGNGLKNMFKRMEDINGSITWTNLSKGLSVAYSVTIKAL